MREQIRSFIQTNFLFGNENIVLTDQQSFLETGIIDSTGVLELVTYLEDTYGIQIEDEELIPENLDSIDNIVRFLEMKQSAATVS